ncbi:MAG TPA: HIT domain-containing protein [candidate division WOR-3 bacterium]|uniref:HIT domain-containing protein n=1 Tax=candidate division WOR-3 bacterium TaxID=2052148 RepID=A0A9C9ELP4_UNCW3|nr:HIT domain-containing protein [candidate division WOR-3 bacterium]
MKNLWAPWRIEYIHNPGKGCFFCDGLKSKDYKEALIVEKGESAFTIMNRYPYNSGHLMVAPIRHIGKLELLDDAEVLELHRLLTRAMRAIKRVMKPQGFNIGINQGEVAGAGVVGHIHIHLVPRWQGDTNFMPVLADTKVVIEALVKNYDNIKQALYKLDHPE